MPRRRRALSRFPRDTESCGTFARDLQRIGAVAAQAQRGMEPSGAGFGPLDNPLIYRFRCRVRRGRGEACGAFEIVREQGFEGMDLPERQQVGNVFGLTRQLSRDIARAWGCAELPRDEGFRRLAQRRLRQIARRRRRRR